MQGSTPRTSLQDMTQCWSVVSEAPSQTSDFQTDPGIAARAKRRQGSNCFNNVAVWRVGSVWKPWTPIQRLEPMYDRECENVDVRSWMDAEIVMVVLASAGIFPLRQATVPWYTPAMAIRVPRWLSLAERTRFAATIALSGMKVLRVTVARTSKSAFFGVITRLASVALVTTMWRLFFRLPMRFRERTRQAPDHSVEKHKPVSGGQPFFITNAFHDNRKYFHGESAAYECQHEPTTTGSALGGVTLTSTCTAGAVFASPASFRAASWRIRIDEHGVAAPP